MAYHDSIKYTMKSRLGQDGKHSMNKMAQSIYGLLTCRKVNLRCQKPAFQSAKPCAIIILRKELQGMAIGWKEVLLVCEAATYLFAGFCTWLRRKEGQKKQETYNLWPFSLFFSGLGLLFVIPSFLFPNAWQLCIFTLPVGYISLLVLNERVRWDTQGFWYRTAMRREIRCEYEAITRMRRFGPTIYPRDLLFYAGKRLILLDFMQGWESFASAYDDWRTRNGLIPWREEEKQRWMERFMRHGVFGRKLDRIWGGRFLLVSSLVSGAICAATGILGLLAVHPDTSRDIIMMILAAMLLLMGIAFPVGYIWGVAHMNKKVLRLYTRNRISPDPLKPDKPKHYRRKK